MWTRSAEWGRFERWVRVVTMRDCSEGWLKFVCGLPTEVETLLKDPDLVDEKRVGCKRWREDGNLVKPKRAQELRYCANRFGNYTRVIVNDKR